MKIPQDMRETIDNASPVGLRAMVDLLLERACENGVAGRNLVDAFRETLDLLRAGRISEATAIAERVVTVSDAAKAQDAHGAMAQGADALSLMRSQGNA